MIKKDDISSLYALKGICAFLVVCCHAPLFSGFEKWLIPLSTSAVPFFFVITGYFLYNEDTSILQTKISKTIKKLIPIIVICNLVYYLWVFPNHGNTIKSWGQIVDLILYGDAIMIPLWYLTALLWGLTLWRGIIALPIRESLLPRIMLCLLPLSLLPVLAISYSFLTRWSYNPFNVFGYALPYIALGFLIKRNEVRLKSIVHLPLVVTSFLLLLGEFLIISYTRSTLSDGPFIMTMPFVGVIFTFLLRHPNLGKTSILTTVGQRYSGNIYYWHMLMLTVGRYGLRFIGYEAYFDDVAVLLSFSLSLILAIIIIKIQDKLNLNVLR